VLQQPVTLEQGRWLHLWSRLGGRGTGRSTLEHLATAYAEPTRFYHTAEHIRDCLIELDRHRKLARRPDEVEAALWFHDAVYVPGNSDNEVGSAHLAQTTLAVGAVPREISDRIAALILATRHLTVPRDPDARLVCDIDLSVLGREPGEFAEFERRIRREYAWVPEATYRSSRSAVLAGFLRRSSIYQIKEFVNRYEARARDNLEHSLTTLTG
jgi:predicted metal-dependent HD superfamily phosphohydrolase